MKISQFTGKYRFLSNFYPCHVLYEGIHYPSVETAFQAAKCIDNNDRIKYAIMNPVEAKKRGKREKLRSDWEEVKFDIMIVIYCK